jgi:hypothetical protein
VNITPEPEGVDSTVPLEESQRDSLTSGNTKLGRDKRLDNGISAGMSRPHTANQAVVTGWFLQKTTYQVQAFSPPPLNAKHAGSGYALFSSTTWRLFGFLPVWRRRQFIRDLLPHEWVSAPTHNNQF